MSSEGGVATRAASDRAELQYGIPLFLDQLIDTLRLEQASGSLGGTAPVAPPATTKSSNAADVGKTATQHGAELLRRGFTLSATEFHTLNRCLDNAIADAVAKFGRQHDVVTSDEATRATNERIGFFAHEPEPDQYVDPCPRGGQERQCRPRGRHGCLLERSLVGLRDLVDYTLIEVRLKAGVVPLSRRGVEADNGKLYAHNLPGTGCVFTIDLPRSAALPFSGMTQIDTP